VGRVETPTRVEKGGDTGTARGWGGLLREGAKKEALYREGYQLGNLKDVPIWASKIRKLLDHPLKSVSEKGILSSGGGQLRFLNGLRMRCGGFKAASTSDVTWREGFGWYKLSKSTNFQGKRGISRRRRHQTGSIGERGANNTTHSHISEKEKGIGRSGQKKKNKVGIELWFLPTRVQQEERFTAIAGRRGSLGGQRFPGGGRTKSGLPAQKR